MNFRCNNCDYETNLKAFLKRHMLQHTVKIEVKIEIEETFRCSQCDFETEHEKFLKRHEMSHKKNKYFKCQKCRFQTLYKKMYLKHVQAHKSKDKDSKKDVKEKSNLGSIKCNECTFEASSQVLLSIHKKLKHTEPETEENYYINLHRCSYCKYQTNWEPCLKRHIEREHLNKPGRVKKEKEPQKQQVSLTTLKEVFFCFLFINIRN